VPTPFIYRIEGLTGYESTLTLKVAKDLLRSPTRNL
jgi:hypothetical protein